MNQGFTTCKKLSSRRAYLVALVVMSTLVVSGASNATLIKFDDLTDTVGAFVDNNANPDPNCPNIDENKAGVACEVVLKNALQNAVANDYFAFFEIRGANELGISDIVGFRVFAMNGPQDLHVQFFSDPMTGPLILGNVKFYNDNNPPNEDGTFQNVTLPPDLPALSIALQVQYKSDASDTAQEVPEPSTLLLLLSAGLGMPFFVRSRARTGRGPHVMRIGSHPDAAHSVL